MHEEGNSLLGMFRYIQKGKPIFLELMTIEKNNNFLELGLKQFNQTMEG